MRFGTWPRGLLLFLCLSLLLHAHGVGQDAPQTVAVFVFENHTGDPGHAWVGLGFAEALSDKLRQVADLRVRDRRTLEEVIRNAEVAPAPESPPASIRAVLPGCDYLVFGAIHGAGAVDHPDAPLRVTARVVEVRTGVVSDALHLDGTMGGMFSLQTQMAILLAHRLRIRLTATEEASMAYHGTDSLAAYRRHTEGIAALDQGEYDKAIAAFREANALHPGILYAEAHHMQAVTFLRSGRTEEMLATFRKDAAELAPIWFNLGEAYARAGEHDKASEAFRTFLDHTDRHVTPWRYDGVPNAALTAPLGDPYSLYLIEADGILHHLDTESGRPRWRKTLSAPTPHVTHGLDIAYFVTRDGVLYAINAYSGEERWRMELGAPASTHVHVTRQGATILVGLTTGELIHIDVASGKERWRRALPAPAESLFDTSAVLLLSDADGFLRALHFDGEDAWSHPLVSPTDALEERDDTVVAVTRDGLVATFSMQTGVERGRVLPRGGRRVLAASAERILFAHGSMLEARDTAGEVLWRVGEPLADARAVWMEGGVVLWTEGGHELVVLDGMEGTVHSRLRLPGTLRNLSLHGTLLVAQLGDGTLHAYRIDPALHEASDKEGYLALAEALDRAGQPGEAIGIYLFILQTIDPESLRALHGLAGVYEKAGRVEEARAVQRRIRARQVDGAGGTPRPSPAQPPTQ